MQWHNGLAWQAHMRLCRSLGCGIDAGRHRLD
jgi:hypothetical protein